MDIPAAWEWSAHQIVRHQWRKVLVIGATDRGKSTYCDFLSQTLGAAGRHVAVVDADVGQKDIGPPATITLGYPEATRPLAQVPPVAWYFVGALSPTGHLLPMIVGTRQLVEAARAACVIVNTTGFVHGAGRVLKGYKIDAIQPDVIVALEKGRELAPLLRAYRHYRQLRLAPSSQATVKTPQQRRTTREKAFAAYFASAHAVTLPWHAVIVQRSLLFTGRRLVDTDYLYAESTAEGIIAIAAGEGPSQPGMTVLPAGFARFLLCGIANRRGYGLGLAILTHIDFVQETFSLYTPVPVENIKLLQFGDLYVSPEGQELGRHFPRGAQSS